MIKGKRANIEEPLTSVQKRNTTWLRLLLDGKEFGPAQRELKMPFTLQEGREE